jgi:translation elongation factor EF-G
VINFKARIVFGSFHEVDSNEMAFKMAGIFAFKEAIEGRQADPPRADHEGRSRHP